MPGLALGGPPSPGENGREVLPARASLLRTRGGRRCNTRLRRRWRRAGARSPRGCAPGARRGWSQVHSRDWRRTRRSKIISQPQFRRWPARRLPGPGPSRRRRVSHGLRLACLLPGCPVCALLARPPCSLAAFRTCPWVSGLGRWQRCGHALTRPGRVREGLSWGRGAQGGKAWGDGVCSPVGRGRVRACSELSPTLGTTQPTLT